MLDLATNMRLSSLLCISQGKGRGHAVTSSSFSRGLAAGRSFIESLPESQACWHSSVSKWDRMIYRHCLIVKYG